MRRLPMMCAAALLAACTEPETVEFGGTGEGGACVQPSDCVPGLGCTQGRCAKLPPLPSGPRRGDPCTSDAQCAPDLVCGRQDVCAPSKGFAQGAPCALTEQCRKGLVCNGQSGTCAPDDGTPGTGALGEGCAELLDCQRPLVCGLGDTCERIALPLNASCTRSDAENGLFRVYFELPPDGATDEFYRLPFPSDIRTKDGHPVLTGHAAPPPMLGLDLREVFFRAVEQDVVGFAPNQPIFFRFSDRVDTRTLCLDAGGVLPAGTGDAYCQGGGAATAYLVDVDPDSPDYAKRVPVQLAVGRDAGPYICQNWLGLAPLDGRPLRQGTTYAAVLTTGIKDPRANAPIRDRDFAAIMDGTTDVPAMEPLLAWIADKGVDKASIAAATVFTVGNPEARARKIREAVHAIAAAPVFGAHVTCGTGAKSPCDDKRTGDAHARGCMVPAGAEFDVLEGTYQAPALQAGTRPFLRPEQGGAISWSASGVPSVTGSETMCFAAAVPRTAAPAGGYPVVVYGHGTGGSFESALNDGTAARLVAAGFVVVGYDNVMHGPRQQPLGTQPDPALWTDPGNVFFNLANPRASRDNIHQGAADLFHLVRLLRNPSSTLTRAAGAVRFDPARVSYYGHSQGTIVSPEFFAAEPDLLAGVMSGAGAELALSLLGKKKPVDAGQVTALFFADKNLTRIHPMMGILSMLFAEADSIAYAQRWVLAPELRGGKPLPLLHVVGLTDSYTPDTSQNAQLRASGLPFVGAVEAAVAGVPAVASPAKNNLNGVTAGAVQLRPDATYDGHFVAFHHAAGKNAVVRFLQTAAATPSAPEIVK